MPSRLINVIAKVDIEKGEGRILFVNPLGGAASADPDGSAADPMSRPWKWLSPVLAPLSAPAINAGPPMPGADAPGGFELRAENEAGEELGRFRPAIKLSQCDLSPEATLEGTEFREQPPASGLIDEIIPFVQGMTALVLMNDGSEIDRFQAGTRSGLPVSLSIGDALAKHTNRRTLEALGAIPEPGVTFTIQVRPENAKAWQTIAIGRATPTVDLDRNQFPGARHARVRVLRNTGFEDEVFAEQEVDLTY